MDYLWQNACNLQMWWRGSGICSRSSAAAESGTQSIVCECGWEALRGHFNGAARVCVYPFEEVLHVLGPCVHHQVVDLLRLDFLEHSAVRVGRHLTQVHVHVVLVAHQFAQLYQTWNHAHVRFIFNFRSSLFSAEIIREKNVFNSL